MPAASMLQIGGLRTKSAHKTVTFTGAANLGAVGAVPIYTVTGSILIIAFVPVVTVDLVSAGGGSISLGVTGSTTAFLGATTATALDTGEFWTTTTPTASIAALVTNLGLTPQAVNADIIGTVTVGDVTAGAIRFDIVYLPLSPDGNLS